MKTINQIIIVLLITACLLLAREDFLVAYNKIKSRLNDSVTSIIYKDSKGVTVSNSKQEERLDNETVNLPSKVVLPGALLIPEKINVTNLSEIPINKSSKFSATSIINITNRHRYENGNISPLKENEKLNFSANKKLEDILNRQYFEHISPDGIGVADLAGEVSYEYITVGENLALGNFSNNEALVSAWMESPGHRANILNSHYREIGVAVKEGIYQGKKVWVSVQHFGLPKSFCPTVDQLLRGVIDLEDKQIKKLETDLATRREMIEKRVVYEGLTTNEQISNYNGMIVVYNKLISELKNKIDTYNKQTREFNDCLTQNTAVSTH